MCTSYTSARLVRSSACTTQRSWTGTHRTAMRTCTISRCDLCRPSSAFVLLCSLLGKQGGSSEVRKHLPSFASRLLGFQLSFSTWQCLQASPLRCSWKTNFACGFGSRINLAVSTTASSKDKVIQQVYSFWVELKVTIAFGSQCRSILRWCDQEDCEAHCQASQVAEPVRGCCSYSEGQCKYGEGAQLDLAKPETDSADCWPEARRHSLGIVWIRLLCLSCTY